MEPQLNSITASAGTQDTKEHVGRGLVITASSLTASLVGQALWAIDITCEQATAENFEAKISRNRYEVVVVDNELPTNQTRVIQGLRTHPSSKTSVVLAIAESGVEANLAFESGAQFVSYRPLARYGLDGVLKAAYGLVLRERRRYFRCPMTATVIGQHCAQAAWRGEVVNISEGGMCLVTPLQLSPGESLEIRLRIPLTSIEIVARCVVQWVGAEGRTGIKFASMSRANVSDLQHWLARQLEVLLPITNAKQ